ncbi:MAG: hypothetical protein RLN86_05530 [Cyclobacteriaceae bacterium]
MKKEFGFIFALALGLIMTSTSFGQDSSQRVDARQTAQRTRIVEGRSSGEVTNREASILRKQQGHIRRAERKAEADGELTRRERRRLERKQDKASRTIRRAKHNDLDNN